MGDYYVLESIPVYLKWRDIMKKGINKSIVMAVIIITALVIAIGVIASLVYASNRLREFKVDMFVLCNESDICVGESSEGQFRISKDNLTALNLLISSTKGDFTLGSPEVTEQFDMTFNHNDDEWKLTVGKAGENRLLVDLRGPRKYKIYIKDNNKYPEMLKCISAKGFHEANKPISINK